MKREVTADNIKKSDIKDLPVREWGEESFYKGILIVPTRRKHESGWSLINIVGIKEDDTLEIASTCDDIVWKIDTDGYDFRTDCYYPSGILHFWTRSEKGFKVGRAYSSTDVELVNKETNAKQ